MGRAFDYYAQAGDVVQAVAVAEHPLSGRSGARHEMARYLGQALELARPDSLTAGRLLSSYGAELGRVEADYDGAQAAFARALEIARKEEDTTLEARTQAASSNVDFFHLRPQESLGKSLRAIELAQEIGDPVIESYARRDAARAVEVLGKDVAEMRRHAAATLELAEKVRDRYQLCLAYRVNATLCRRLGEWARAREFSDRGLALGPRDITFLGDRVLLEHEVGGLAQGQLYLDRLLEFVRQAPARAAVVHVIPAGVIPYVARITGALDHEDVAAKAAETVLSSSTSEPLYTSVARLGLALLTVQHGDASAAGDQYHTLQAAQLPFPGGAILSFNSDRLLGLLAHTMGNLERATAHFEEALTISRNIGLRLGAGLELLRIRRRPAPAGRVRSW